MKSIKNILFVAALGLVTFTSCKNEKAEVKEAATETLATTETKTTKPLQNQVAPQVNTKEEVPVGPLTKVKFDDEVFDFGTINEGDVVTHKYTFTNTGSEPLVLSKVKPACGCTTPKWTRDPIAPGETGTIEARYDSKGKGAVGGKKEMKTITVTANTEPRNTTLRITGTIMKKEGATPAGK